MKSGISKQEMLTPRRASAICNLNSVYTIQIARQKSFNSLQLVIIFIQFMFNLPQLI